MMVVISQHSLKKRLPASQVANDGDKDMSTRKIKRTVSAASNSTVSSRVRVPRRKHHYPRNTPPVRLPTSATILAATASISSSVMVLSRGCKVTAMAIDFLPGSMPLPS
jgi:hypothetical protein